MSAFPADAYRLQEYEECLGPLQNIEESPDGGLLCQVGKILLWLPPELAGTLRGMVGQRIGILKLSGYRLRAL